MDGADRRRNREVEAVGVQRGPARKNVDFRAQGDGKIARGLQPAAVKAQDRSAAAQVAAVISRDETSGRDQAAREARGVRIAQVERATADLGQRAVARNGPVACRVIAVGVDRAPILFGDYRN